MSDAQPHPPRERQSAMKDFLGRAGWDKAVVTPLAGDASTRRYGRLTMASRTAILMDQPQTLEAATAPIAASEQTRRALGYNALARLAGADCARFVAAATWLRHLGLAAPAIYATDCAQGFVLLEDLGDGLFSEVLANGAEERSLYEAAVEVLAKIHAQAAPAVLSAGTPLLAYDLTALIAETSLLTEWFLPLALKRKATRQEACDHRALWHATLQSLGDSQPVFVHRDYHAQNLLWLAQRQGLARVGLIDFQDAVAGRRAYDLISLTQDARRDVSAQLADASCAHYLAMMKGQGLAIEAQSFAQEMAVMAAQRNAKIIGIFARLFLRDGKARYLGFLPRVWSYMERDLRHPALADLRAWYDRVIPKDKRAVETD